MRHGYGDEFSVGWVKISQSIVLRILHKIAPSLLYFFWGEMYQLATKRISPVSQHPFEEGVPNTRLPGLVQLMLVLIDNVPAII